MLYFIINNKNQFEQIEEESAILKEIHFQAPNIATLLKVVKKINNGCIFSDYTRINKLKLDNWYRFESADHWKFRGKPIEIITINKARFLKIIVSVKYQVIAFCEIDYNEEISLRVFEKHECLSFE